MNSLNKTILAGAWEAIHHTSLPGISYSERISQNPEVPRTTFFDVYYKDVPLGVISRYPAELAAHGVAEFWFLTRDDANVSIHNTLEEAICALYESYFLQQL